MRLASSSCANHWLLSMQLRPARRSQSPRGRHGDPGRQGGDPVVNPRGLHSAQGRQLLKDASRKQATEDGKSPQVLLSLVLHNGPGDTVETIDIDEAQGGICARCIYPSRKRRTVPVGPGVLVARGGAPACAGPAVDEASRGARMRAELDRSLANAATSCSICGAGTESSQYAGYRGWRPRPRIPSGGSHWHPAGLIIGWAE